MSTDQRDGRRAVDTQGPTVPRLLVGIQLHRFREAAGFTELVLVRSEDGATVRGEPRALGGDRGGGLS